MKPAFAQTVEQSRGDMVYLVKGGVDYTKQSTWYFIRVESYKVRLFNKAIADGSIDLSTYGTILESGYGKEPPYSVLEYMRANHGYNG